MQQSERHSGVTLDQKPDALFLRLIDVFKEMGIPAPLIHGGALRDYFLRIPYADIDIRLPLRDEESDPAKSLDAQMRYSGYFANVSNPDLIAMGGTALRCRFSAEFEGHKLDIVQDTDCPDTAGLISIADSAINAIVIDPDARCFRAHPSFEEHVRERIYAPASTCQNV
jgi:hypothetical protein